jgi:hypothetical protein
MPNTPATTALGIANAHPNLHRATHMPFAPSVAQGGGAFSRSP